MQPTRTWSLVAAGLLSAGLASSIQGCEGSIGGTDTVVPPVDPEASCSVTSAPIRRLTPVEYQNTIGALFPGVTPPSEAPLPDSRIDGFVGHADGQSVSALGVQRYESLAESIASAAAASPASWAPCTDDSEDCVVDTALELGFRAYRRPLEPVEEASLTSFASNAYAAYGRAEALELVIRGLLESPSFLFRPEIAPAGSTGVVALGDYEMASRLSYFFLDTMPDDALFDAASRGELATDAGLEAQARRLLADPRARPILTGFFAEWLRLYEIEELALDAAVFPELDEALRADLEASARLFLDKALWDDDSWQSLMTGSYGFVNDRLAPIFGVEAPGSSELVLVELDPSERRGVLTQPALLASTSHGISHSPIYRGVTMLDSVLCQKMPAPPPGILDDFEPLDVPPEELCTVRDRVSKTHTVGSCQSCHASIDGAGFSFEAYDALGRYRTEENGCAIDSSGNFPDTIGEVSGPIDMVEKLVESEVVAACSTTHLVRYALGRSEREGDRCEIEALAVSMRQGDSLQETIVGMVMSPSFRSRRGEN